MLPDMFYKRFIHYTGASRHGMFRLLFLLLFFTAYIFSPSSLAAELSTEVDRTTVIDGESVVLYIEGTDITQLPDTSSLNTNFRIVQSGQSSSQTIVNGKSSRKITLRLELQPKSLGSVVIPAFTASGASSDPITIEVVPRGTPGVEPRDKVFAELSVDNRNPYVQEQVILSLKIFDDGNLASADPALTGNSDYQVEQLPLAREQIVERNGVQYRVNTFRYALFPQQSGEITIDRVRIPASIRDNSYTGNLILFNTPTRRIELTSDSITLEVKPRAAASTSGWWLPVKALELKHEWSSDISNAKAGEPLTLTLELQASGSTATQLPEIPVPDVPGVKIYVDNPEFGSQPDGSALHSVRREKWSVIPNQTGPDGTLTLPEVVVKWWDTVADIERRAVIPEQKLVVSGGASLPGASADTGAGATANAANSQVQSQPPVSDVNKQAPGSSAESEAIESLLPAGSSVNAIGGDAANSQPNSQLVARYWLWVAVAAATAWLATLAAWWWSARRRGNSADNDQQAVKAYDKNAEQKMFKRLQSIASSGDTQAYSHAVLEWANTRWTEKPTRNLPDIGSRFEDSQLIDQMRLLDKLRYSGLQTDGQQVSLTEIHHSLESALRHDSSSSTSRTDQSALPQL